MAFIYYGTKKAFIGIDEVMIKCPACEAHNFADVMVNSIYYHIYFIPIFPIGKEVNIVCQKCGLRRYDLPLSESIFGNINELNRKFRHPWYTYLFVLIVSAGFLVGILV